MELPFRVSYNRLEGLNFIQRFATAYSYIQGCGNRDAPPPPETGGWCVGCNPDCPKARCDRWRCAYFFLFNTMTGNGAIRCRFDGAPTGAQLLVGDTPEEAGGCGSDFVAGFLFGYAGYPLLMSSDPSRFAEEIAASVREGKPAIARIRREAVGRVGSRFHLINGIDGERLSCPEFLLRDFDWDAMAPTGPRPEPAPELREIEAIYRFGDRGARSYALVDGLYNIRNAMDWNLREDAFGGALRAFGGWGRYDSDESFERADPAERSRRAKRLQRTVMYVYNICSFAAAFTAEAAIPGDPLFGELNDPRLSESWLRLGPSHDTILEGGHRFQGPANVDWATADGAKAAEVSAGILDTIEGMIGADADTRKVIDEAIAILSGNQ